MTTVRWLTAARDDLNEIVAYIARRSPRRAEKLAKRILDRVALLSEMPESGSICPHFPEARQLIFGNYIVYFTLHQDIVVVRAVVHGARLFQKAWLERDE